nr:hypothetical protein [Tanacetum cinerariifolium]
MLTARKSVGSLPALRLASRYPSDSSSSDSSSRYSSSGYAISDYPDDSSTATSTRLSRKRCRSSTSYVPAVSLVHRALSPVCADLSPPPKRIVNDTIRARGIDDRDVVETAAEEEVGSRKRDTVEVEVDLRVKLVIEDDVCEFVREDVLDHVTTDGAVEVT